jgi:ferredoxin
MADIANKYAENVSGKFYVDDQCIDCDLCRETAPANFRRSDDGGYSYVFKSVFKKSYAWTYYRRCDDH